MSTVGFVGDRRNSAEFKKLDAVRFRTRKAIRESWFRLGIDLSKEANEEIKRKPKSGRTYIIRTAGGRRRRHVASAPGETHANLSGRLRRSVSWKVHGSERMEFGYGFSTTAANAAPEYDIHVEDGTSRMAARPSIANAVKKIKSTTTSHFEKAMLKQFKRTT
jgi:hypothetical protein